MFQLPEESAIIACPRHAPATSQDSIRISSQVKIWADGLVMNRNRGQISCIFLTALFAATLSGCSNFSLSNPFAFSKPPVSTSSSHEAQWTASERTIIAVGKFESPANTPVPWKNIGTGMSNALSRSLLNRDEFDVWIDSRISNTVLSDLKRSLSRRGDDFTKLQAAYPDVHFIITGKVTDFHHTSELPEEVSRWGLFKKRSEAIVAIDFSIFDLRRGRVVATNHVIGTAGASQTPAKDMYNNLEFGSYLFWSTPLGKASREAIDKTILRVIESLPTHMGEPSILSILAQRKVSVTGGWAWGIKKGQQFYICQQADETSPIQAVFDPDTKQPLRIQIHRVEKDRSVAWLLGKIPPAEDLHGALLLKFLPQDPTINNTLSTNKRASLANGK